jgi:hypothetical protein
MPIIEILQVFSLGQTTPGISSKRVQEAVAAPPAANSAFHQRAIDESEHREGNV